MLPLLSSRPKRSSVTRQPSHAATESASALSTGRDRFIDLVRLLAIAVVVLEHWLMPVLSFDGSRLTVGNALAAPGRWPVTWITQVMPLVFFAGGAANAMSWRAHQQRGGSSADWHARRTRRLAWPLLPLAALWIPLPHLLLAAGVPAQPVSVGAHVVGQLVWFLAAYLLTTLFTPLLARVRGHRAWLVPVGLALGAVAIDAARFLWFEPVGYLNVLLVWLAIHQVGGLYQAGELAPLTRRQLAAIAGTSLVGLAALVRFGPYPATMIGMPDAATSNMSPPTACLLFLALAQISVALLFRQAVKRAARNPVVEALLHWATPRLMTIYLWHMPALVVVALAAVVGLRVATPASGTIGWWLISPAWIAALGATLALELKVFARYEQPPSRAIHVRTGRLIAAIALVGAGLCTLMCVGFQPQRGVALLVAGPVPAAVALAVGLGLLGARGRHRTLSR